jgi:hypothetical protein
MAQEIFFSILIYYNNGKRTLQLIEIESGVFDKQPALQVSFGSKFI